MISHSNASAFSSAALRADQKASPLFLTSKSSAHQRRKQASNTEIPPTFRKPAAATLRRQLLAQKQQILAKYLAKALPQSYLFHVFASSKSFSYTKNISKNAYKFTPAGFIVQRPAPLSEIFVFLRLPDSQAPLPILNEIRRLKLMGKIVLSVLGVEDLAFHLKSLGIGLNPVSKASDPFDLERF